MMSMFKTIPVILIVSIVAVQGCDPETESSPKTIVANFEGEKLRLAEGWKDANSCVVWQGATECFRNDADADALIREIEAGTTPNTVTPPSAGPEFRCSHNCLHLYQHNDFNRNRQGRHLTFCDRGYWQNLGDYSFNDELSSYKTGDYGVHLSYHANGAGHWYPGDTSACTSSSQMRSGWDNEVSAIFIE